MAEASPRDKFVVSIIGLVMGVLIGVWCAGNALFIIQNFDRAVDPQKRTVLVIFVTLQGIASVLFISCGIVGVIRNHRRKVLESATTQDDKRASHV